MRLFLLANRGGGPDNDDRAILAFRDLWLSGVPSIGGYWRGLGPGRSLPLLSALAKIELKARFDRGERPRAAEIFGQFPELIEDGDRVTSLIYEEFCLLEEAGEGPDSAEFCREYAPWTDSIRSQIVFHRELSRAVGSPTPAVKFPEPGDRFATYHLRSLLGRGGAAHVYLAIDEELGRKVALKVSASVGREPSILANLDHPNIVPIHSMTDPTEEGLRGFCMPYRPGITLEDLIRRLGRGKPGRKADLIWKALNPPDEAPERPATDDRPGWSGFPSRGTFDEAVAWLGAKLADAVHYLHEHKVIHRDIKPGNILLADREGPQLLDFHLAHAPNAPAHAQAALTGGTLPYMAPEQLRAFLDPDRWGDVRESADIYALGLVLRELVTGRSPDLPDHRLPLTRAISGLLDRRSGPTLPVVEVNPSIPPSLAAIIDKCLAPEPGDRFGSARELADDLKLFLQRRPLVSAPNTSSIERFANLVHRQWKTCAGLLVLGATAAMMPIGRDAARDTKPRFPDRPEFRAAIADLDCNDQGRWELAQQAFEKFHKAEPHSAYPTLYLSQACEKFDRRPRANDLIREAQICPDFDEAIERRIKENPTSVTLLLAQCDRLIRNEQYEAADALLRRIRGAAPTHRGALLVSGNLERYRKNYARAIGFFRAVIDSAAKQPGNEAKILVWRMALVQLLPDQAGQELEKADDPQAIEKASRLLAEMGVEMEIVSREIPRLPTKGMEEWDFSRNFYAGVMESGLCAIAIAKGRTDSARDHLDLARKAFDRAEEASSADDPNDSSRRDRVEKQRESLETRAAKIR